MLLEKDSGGAAALVVRHGHEVIRVEPWGSDSVRVRAAQMSVPATDVGALDLPPARNGLAQMELRRLATGLDALHAAMRDKSA